MESVDQGNLENDGTYQFLRYLSQPAEPCDTEDPPTKRTKLDNQTRYIIDRTAAAPEYISIEPSENPTSRKQNSSLNATYSSDMGNSCQSRGQRSFSASVWDVVDPQGSVRGLTATAPTAVPPSTAPRAVPPALNTGMVSSYGEKSKSIGKVLTPKVYCNCTMYPPPNGIVPEPTMERPLGCKTVLISGLPNSLSYETLWKVFSYFGKILNLVRKNKEDGFRVTYSCESSIDKVLELNGYTLVSNSGNESLKGVIQISYVGIWTERLDHISRMKAQQKGEKQNGAIIRPNCMESITSLETSYSIPKFSNEDIRKMLKEICGDGLVNYSTNTFIRWMEEGECKKNNTHEFFNILSAMNISVSRLMNDTAKLEKSVHQQQNSLREKYSSNSLYFMEIQKAFHAATSKAVFNQFSPSMRKKINAWKKYIEDINVSDSRNLTSPVMKEKAILPNSEISAQNSPTVKQVIELKAENERLKKELRVAQREASEMYHKQILQRSDDTKSEDRQTKNIDYGDPGIEIVEKEARLIAMIGAFLSFHRFGESTESICKHLLKIDPAVTSKDIECLMRKLPTVFKEVSIAGADDSETKWTVCGI